MNTNNYIFYVCDTETTGLSATEHDVIELSLYRLGADIEAAQKTWCLKPLNPNNVEPAALRINGHKIDDLTHKTKEGRDRYIDPNVALIEIENWLVEDGFPAEKRCLIGQNISFDKERLENLWIKCGSKDSFPFGRRYMDTMIFALMMDYAEGTFSDNYSLSGLIKKYGIKNTKAHSAAADVLATKELFEAQMSDIRKKLGIK